METQTMCPGWCHAYPAPAHLDKQLPNKATWGGKWMVVRGLKSRWDRVPFGDDSGGPKSQQQFKFQFQELQLKSEGQV